MAKKTTMNAQTVRAALAASILFAFAGAGFALYAILTRAAGAARATTPAPIATAHALQAAFVRAADRLRPALVHTGTLQGARGGPPLIRPAPMTAVPSLRVSFE